MKIKKLLMAFFAIAVLTACSEQETNSTESLDSFTIAKKNWQERTLTSSFFENQGKVSHYSFSKKEVQSTLTNPNITDFRFVLGLENDQIIINLVGVSYYGEEMTSISSIPNFNSDLYATPLKSLQNNPFQYSKARLEAPIIGKHLLPYDLTYTYINNWHKTLSSGNIEEMITDEGIRFRYYSLEKEVIAEMISRENTESIALFLGLNSENKLTTVFLKKDKENLLILNTGERNLDGDSLDFTTPCPSACDPCYCDDGTRTQANRLCPDGSTPDCS